MKPSKPIKRRALLSRVAAPRKFSQKDLPKLRVKFWKIFSEMIKRRDGGKCISCGSDGLEGVFAHAGHLFTSKMHGSVRYHPKNVHTQCRRCNIFMSGAGPDYAREFIRKYGTEFFEEMYKKSKELKKWTAPEIVELARVAVLGIEEYTKYYEEMYGPRYPN